MSGSKDVGHKDDQTALFGEVGAVSPAPSPPAGMVAVSEAEFFALLFADRRDIMPSHREPEWTSWETTSRERWGWSAPGWRNAGAHAKTFAVRSATALGRATPTPSVVE